MKIKELELGKVYAKRKDTYSWGVVVSTEKLYKKAGTRSAMLVKGRNLLVLTKFGKKADPKDVATAIKAAAAMEKELTDYPDYYKLLHKANDLGLKLEVWSPASIGGEHDELVEMERAAKERKESEYAKATREAREIQEKLARVANTLGIDRTYSFVKDGTVRIPVESMNELLERMETILDASPMIEGSL